MADSTLDSELFTLVDNWPGVAVTPTVELNDFTSAAMGHNQAVAAVRLGTKFCVYNVVDASGNGEPGPSTFVYLRYEETGAPTLAAKQVVVQDSATIWYSVTNDPDSCVKIPTGLAAIAISTMTDAYYGWFWCGGVCPEYFVAGLGGNFATDSNVDVGPICAHDLAADAIGLGPCITTTTTMLEPPFGYAIAADA